MEKIADHPETWASLPGPRDAQVSTLGRLRSCGKIREPTADKDGYLVTVVERHRFRMAPAILTAFVGPKPTPAHEAGHRNGVRDDNRISNLHWVTRKENFQDKLLHGTHPTGEAHWKARLDWEKVAIIRAEPYTYARCKRLSEEWGIDITPITRAARYRGWIASPDEL